MAGNILSVALWCAATDFRTFLLSRVVGGLSEGNVQLATAIAADVSTEEQRGSTMAMVGACFSVAFTFGPALGAYLASITTVAANPFATAAGFSLFLVVTETVYLYLYLPETRPSSSTSTTRSTKSSNIVDPKSTTNGSSKPTKPTSNTHSVLQSHTNSPVLLNLVHFLFLLPFSGMEFSLPFLMTVLYPSHPSPSRLNGRLLGFVGLIASILQGSIVRRLAPLTVVRSGVLACTAAFFLLARVNDTAGLYAAGAMLAVTSATVVTGLNALGSLEASADERGKVLGALRSSGQLGRAMGPVVFCSMFWLLGREMAYLAGGVVMLGVLGLVFGTLRHPSIAKDKKT